MPYPAGVAGRQGRIAGLALVADIVDPCIEVSPRLGRYRTARHRDAGRMLGSRDTKDQRRRADRHAIVGGVARGIETIGPVVGPAIGLLADWRAHHESVGILELEPPAVGDVLNAGVVDGDPKRVTHRRIAQSMDGNVSRERLKSARLQKRVFCVDRVIVRQQAFVERRNLPAEFFKPEHAHG